jgi:hypothetical protein
MNVAARMCSNANEGSICASPDFVCCLEGATDSASEPQSSVSEPQSSVSEPQSSVNAKGGSMCAGLDLHGSEQHVCTDESYGLLGGCHAFGGGGGLQPPSEPSAQPEQPVSIDERNETITATSGGLPRSGVAGVRGGGRGGGCSAADGCVSTDERKLTTTATACGVHHIREQTSADVCAHIREQTSAYVCVSRGVNHIKGKGPMELFDITLPATRTGSSSSSSSGFLLKEVGLLG